MAIKPSYIPLEIEMVKRRLSKKEVCNATGIAPSTFTRMKNNEWVALQIIARICDYLDCRIEDVVEFVSDKSVDERNTNDDVKVAESRWHVDFNE